YGRARHSHVASEAKILGCWRVSLQNDTLCVCARSNHERIGQHDAEGRLDRADLVTLHHAAETAALSCAGSSGREARVSCSCRELQPSSWIGRRELRYRS